MCKAITVPKPHMRNRTSYLCTVPNVMDYGRILVYLVAVHGHYNGMTWAMPAAIICNGVIDDLDGKVARALDQCSTMGYLVDCTADILAVMANTGCIASAALSSATLSVEVKWLICGGVQLYALFFIYWSALATAIPNYKGNHHSRLARWYYGTLAGDLILYLGMQVFWCVLYMYAADLHRELVFPVLVITSVIFALKVSVEVENVLCLVDKVMDKDRADALAQSISASTKKHKST
uniref:CDP-diacylglycerol--inositol 3-phosphatidyltransferase n=1 Tax=Haptolina brevifila TaxID=156173 RepID=A0A7S2MJL1_9EUKA